MTVNGQIAILGDKADPKTDVICLNGNELPRQSVKNIYIALNKPQKVLSEVKKLDKRTTVVDLIGIPDYLFIVGRLDYMSEGLILLTNDGELANQLTHPRYEHDKEYRVLIKGTPAREQVDRWRNGVKLESGHKTIPAYVKMHSMTAEGTWLKIILKEGKKRQIREVGKILGLQVKRIIRIRIATLQIGKLDPGQWRYLENDEIAAIRKSCSLN